MKKVCVYTYSYLPSMEGGPLYSNKQIDKITKTGYNVVVISRRRKYEKNCLIGYNNVKVKKIKSLYFKWTKYNHIVDRFFTYNLSVIETISIECKDAELLHILPHSIFFPVGYLTKKRYNIPIVTSIIEDFWAKPQNDFLTSLFFKYQKWQVKIALKHSDIVTIPNEIGLEHIEKKFPQYREKLRLIPGFIETNVFNPFIEVPNSLRKKYEDYKIIFVPQRLVQTKGVDIAIKALKQVLQHMKKSSNIIMLIAEVVR